MSSAVSVVHVLTNAGASVPGGQGQDAPGGFHREFPSLQAAPPPTEPQRKEAPKEVQYGPGPSLRPQSKPPTW